jgi:hypothetical protein
MQRGKNCRISYDGKSLFTTALSLLGKSPAESTDAEFSGRELFTCKRKSVASLGKTAAASEDCMCRCVCMCGDSSGDVEDFSSGVSALCEEFLSKVSGT